MGRSSHERSGLLAVDEIEGCGFDAPSFGLEVYHLAAYHAIYASRFCKDGDGSEAAVFLGKLGRLDRVVLAAGGGKHLEGVGQQGVAGQYGHRFSENDVRRRLATSQGGALP